MQAQNSGNPAGFSEIHTGRLILRALEEKDARRIFQYRSHPEVSRFQSWGTKSSAEVQSHIKKLSATPRGTTGFWHQLGICLLANGNLIGDCGFHVLEAEPRQAECGITLDPSHQGTAMRRKHCVDCWTISFSRLVNTEFSVLSIRRIFDRSS
jgi:RimJ/RimL family protein N-acetyltransferase